MKKVFLGFGILLAAVLAGILFYAIVELTPDRTRVSEIRPENTQDEKPVGSPDARKKSAGTPLPDFYFTFKAKSHTEIRQQEIQNVNADMAFKYSREKTNEDVLLTFYLLKIKMVQNGVPQMDSEISRDKIVENNGGQNFVTTFDEMPLDQQEKSIAAFGTPVCRLHLDENQNELSREILSDAAYGVWNDGNINSAQLMHGPYILKSSHWKSVKRIPMTAGFVIDCPLDYQRSSDGSREVKMSGSLTKDEITSEQSEWILKQVNCRVSGVETFDENLGEYVSGNVTVDYDFVVHQPNAEPAKMKGTLEISLKRVSKLADAE